jgi:hypothetical protein
MLREHNLAVVKELGVFGLKTVLTLNSGALIVLLTFTGSMLTSERAFLVVSFDLIEAAMVAFLFGITFNLASIVATYTLAYDLASESPILKSMTGFDHWFVQVAPVVVAFGFFWIGVLVALSAVSV